MQRASMIMRLALRNLFRQVRRTLLTTTVIVAGVGLFVLGEGFIAGIEDNIIVSAIEGTSGHVQARPVDYPDQIMQHPIDKLLEIDATMQAWLDSHSEAWTGRQIFTPSASFNGDSLRVRAIGYDPVRDPLVFSRRLWRIDGHDPDGAANEVIVSTGVAGLLGVKTGDHFVLQARTHEGAMNALEVAVAGIVTTTHTTIDTIAIFVPSSLSNRLIATDKPSHVSLHLAGRDQAEAAAVALRGVIGAQASVVTWDDETRELIRLQAVRRKALNGLVFILLALAGFGMANTILMAAYERIQEIGTLRAMGMTEGGVLGLFVCEGLLMGIAGGLAGIAWGGALVAWWAANPIDMMNLSVQKVGNSIQFSALIYTHFSVSALVGGLVFAVVVAVLSSIWPARVASRMAPADAVRAT